MTTEATIDWGLARRIAQADITDKDGQIIPIPDDQWQRFQYVCEARGLDPLRRQIYLQARWDKTKRRYSFTIITGIDGYRLIAERTGLHAGTDKPEYTYKTGGTIDKCIITVYRIVQGLRCAFQGEAYWDEYNAGFGLWMTMKHVMISKCAEANGMRKAFPGCFEGVYIAEEMEQADRQPVHEAPPPPAKHEPNAPTAEPTPTTTTHLADIAKAMKMAKLALLALVKNTLQTDQEGAVAVIREAAVTLGVSIDSIDGLARLATHFREPPPDPTDPTAPNPETEA